MLLGYFLIFIFAGLAIRGQAAVTPFLFGNGSAQLLGGVDEVGDGDPVELVPGPDLRVLQVLLHARARVGRVQMYRYADGQMNKSVDRR